MPSPEHDHNYFSAEQASTNGPRLIRFTRGFAVLLVCCLVNQTVAAQPPVEQPGAVTTTIESAQAEMSRAVLKAGNFIDRFFFNERHSTWEDNDTSIRLRLNFDAVEDHGTDVNPEVKLNLVLPIFDGRLRLVGNDDDDEGADSGDRDVSDDSSIALRYVGIDTDKWGASYDLGLRVRDSNAEGFGRINVIRNYDLSGSWAGRTANRLYWYTNAGWRDDARQYFERRISDKVFFRARTRLQWFEEESGVFTEQRFTLFQQLSDKSALAYEVLARKIPGDDSVFDDDEILRPDNNYNQAQLRLRYRQNFKWPWFFYEVWPIAAFTEERDYDLTLALRLRLEIILGRIRETKTRLDE